MDYGFQSTYRSTFKNFIANTGRKAGLWTLHGKSGSNLSVAGDTFLIRINPEAWESILKVFCQTSYGLDLISISYPHPDNLGWRKVPWYNVKEGAAVELYKLVRNGVLQIKGGDDKYFLVKDMRESNDVLVRDHMEHLISKYELTELTGTDPEGWLVKALFPNVPSELVVKNYMTYSSQERLERELKEKEAQLAKEIKEVRELRRVSRSFHKIGGWDGLLTAMGKDIQDNLTLHAADWARGVEDDKETRFTFRKLNEAITNMARDYLEGTLEFPEG